jgi:hypothetical protein
VQDKFKNPFALLLRQALNLLHQFGRTHVLLVADDGTIFKRASGQRIAL